MATFTVITTCKGRLQHLQHTLPIFLQGADRVCVVDYSCPQGAGDWAEATYGGTGRLLVKRVVGQKKFNKSKAANAGAKHLWSLGLRGFYCFLDADNIAPPPFWSWLRSHARRDAFYIVATTSLLEQVRFRLVQEPQRTNQLSGALVVGAVPFMVSGGYDEGFKGRGFQDLDMRLRLYLKMNMPFAEIPRGLLGVINHSARLRTAHYSETQRQAHKHNKPRMRANAKRWTGSRLTRIDDVGAQILQRTSGTG